MEQWVAQLAREDRGRKGLSGTGRTDQQELAARRQPVVLELGGVALLADHPLEPVVDLRGRDQVGQPQLGRRRVQQAAAVLEAPGDRNRSNGRRTLATLLDDIAQLLRQLPMATARLVGRDL